MTNPHPTAATGIDIAASAGSVVLLIQQGQVDDGLRLLQQVRQAERPIVQEALDRYVAAEAMPQLNAHALAGRLEAADRPIVDRLRQALGPPRMPDVSHQQGGPNELVGLTDAQKYDVYASTVTTRGTDTARDDLQRHNHSVLLGLRRETSTLASPGGGRAGTGVYDDQIVVLTRAADGEKRIFIASRASTEPTAQYSHQAGSNGNRAIAGPPHLETRRLAPAPGYEDVHPRAIQGEDVDGDTMRDLGRLAEGTFELQLARHQNPASAGTRVALRPSNAQLAPDRRRGLVERDTNGDGLFTAADPERLQDLNPTFKIHSGSRQNTDSAGCQTVHPDDYLDFVSAVQSNPAQEFFPYVLTSTHDGEVRDAAAGRAGPPADETRPVEPGGDRQNHTSVTPQPFGDEGLNRYLAAVMSGNAALADRIALGFSPRSTDPPVQGPVEARNDGDEATSQRQQAAQARAPDMQV